MTPAKPINSWKDVRPDTTVTLHSGGRCQDYCRLESVSMAQLKPIGTYVLAQDIFEEAQRCDTIVLASGDGDFDILLERIKQRFDTRTEIYGVPKLTSNQLIGSASRFVSIDRNLLLKSQAVAC